MSRFTSELIIRYYDDNHGRQAVLLESLVWECDEKGSGLLVTVPFGFVSDGASVPRFLWWLMPAWGDRGTRAAILHDFIKEEMIAGRPIPGASTHWECDHQFYLALKALRVEEWRARLCYWGVLSASAVIVMSQKLSWIPFMPKLR